MAIRLVVAVEARPSVGGRQESLESQDPVDLMPWKELRFEPPPAVRDEGSRRML
jgi:hypothetical protein